VDAGKVKSPRCPDPVGVNASGTRGTQRKVKNQTPKGSGTRVVLAFHVCATLASEGREVSRTRLGLEIAHKTEYKERG